MPGNSTPPALRTRLLAAFLAPTLVVLALGGTLLFRYSRQVLEAELGNTLSTVAATIASQVKADRVLSLEAGDDEGEGSRTFRSLTAQLTEAKERAKLRRVLVFDTAHRARLDVGGGLPLMTEVPELLRDSAELERVRLGERVSSQVLFEGLDGQLYKTGYAPLLQDGKVVGAVAVEGTAAFFGPLTRLRNAFIALAAVVLVLLALVAFSSARALASPLERLVKSALRIGGGDLSTPVPEEPTLEIGVLSRELEAMRQALDSRDRQLKLMLGGVAHEVKNPLGGMELFSGLLDEELTSQPPDVAQARSHLTRIQRELDYLKRIVEDFLSFAREQKLQRDSFDAQQLASGSVQHLQGEAEARGITLVQEVAAAPLEGDVGLLTSALVNLVKNAVQASSTGQTVRVTGSVVDGRYRFEVSDTGSGIPAEVQARIFEPFFTTREKGTGLGLPLAKKLVEAHGGTLSLTSAPGATTFRLSLPVKPT
jgi:signal transduction histidine kinase